MKSIRQFWLICVSLLSVCFHRASAWNDKGLTDQADSLFKSGQFQKAAIAFERAGFETSDPVGRTFALLGKAECLKKMNKFFEAEETLLRVEYSKNSDSISTRIRFQTALCGYLAGNFSNAESQIQQLFFFNRDSASTQFALPLYALILNEQSKWSEAYLKMRTFINLNEKSERRRDSIMVLLNHVFDEKFFPIEKSERRARRLSMIIPGAGQIYAGKWGEGFSSFGLNLTALAFVGLNFWNAYYITTFTVGTMGLQMVYAGGIERAELLTRQYNLQSKYNYNRELRDVILSIDRLIGS